MCKLIHELHSPIPEQGYEEIAELASQVCEAAASWFEFQHQQEILSMIATELLANTIRYNDWTHTPRPTFDFLLYDNSTVKLSTTNSPRDPECASRLRRVLRETASRDGAEQAYRRRMHDLLRKPFELGTSTGLGIIRIAHEAAAQLSLIVANSGLFILSAQINLEAYAKGCLGGDS